MHNTSLNHSWTVQNNHFYIVEAQLSEKEAIIFVAQEAFYQAGVDTLKVRDFSLKNEFGVVDIPRRIQDRESYSVLVCKLRGKEGGPDKVVGTAYYQAQKTDFIDEKGIEVAEFGLLAVLPDYARVNNIGFHLLSVVEELAIKDRKRGIYLYVKGTKDPVLGNNNPLVGFYEKKGGYEFVANRESSVQKWFGNKSANQVLMLKDLSERSCQERIKLLQNKKNQIYPVPPKNAAIAI